MLDQEKTKDQLINELVELRGCLDALVNNLPEGVVVVDPPDAKVRLVSRYGQQMLGVSEEDGIEGLHGEEHFRYYQMCRCDGASPTLEQLPLARALCGGEVIRNEEWIMRLRDGRMIPVSCNAGPVRNGDGEITGAVLSWQDVTDRKLGEEALRQSEVRFRTVAENAPFGISIDDEHGHILFLNEQFQRTFGYTLSDIPDQANWYQRAYPDEKYREQVLAVWNEDVRRMRDGAIRRSPVHEYRVTCQDGSVKDVEITFAIVGGNTYVVFHDVTDRKRAEAELQHAHDDLERRVEQRTTELTKANEELAIFRRFADACGQGFGMADLDGHITYVNPALCRMFGEERPEDVLGKHVSAYYSAETIRQRETETLPALYRTGHWQGERTILSRQGKPIPTLHDTFFVRDSEGKPIRLAAVITDISERKQAEEALQRSEEKYRTLVDTSPDGVIMTDVEGRLLFASERVREMHGAERVEDLLGRSPFDFLAQSDQVRFSKNVERTLKEGVTRNIEYSFLRNDGTSLAGEVSAAVIRDRSGEPMAVVAILRDITERKQAQEALQQANDQLQTICEEMVEGLLITDIETKHFMRVNSSLCRMLGYSEQELLAASIKDIHPPEEVPNDLRRFQAAAEGQVSINEERPVLRKDGSIFYADITGHSIVYDGRPCLLALFRDITERRRTRLALERERRTLQHMLESSDRERQLIAYEIHDSVAQQLTGAIMQFQTYASLKETKRRLAARAFSAGLTLLQQSHYEIRRLITDVRPPILDESGVVAAIAHLVHEPAFDKGPTVDFRSRVTFTRLAPVMENAIYRIVQEGLTNACKHSSSKKIVVSLVQRADRLRIEIRDWGVGFDTKVMPKGRFGLEGIRQRVRLLGGRCSIRSRLGNGTAILVELPVVEMKSGE